MIVKRLFFLQSNSVFVMQSLAFENTDFDDLGEGFCFKSSYGNFGIICVFRNFHNAELEQKTRPNRESRIFRGANKNWTALLSGPW